MFWKKSDKSTVSFTFPNMNDCQRGSFRIDPEEDSPIYVQFGNERTKVVNISAGGLAFENHGFKEGEAHDVSLHLPGEYRDVRCVITVLRMNPKGDICFTNFSELDDESRDVLHHYVLARQKQELQKKKSTIGLKL